MLQGISFLHAWWTTTGRRPGGGGSWILEWNGYTARGLPLLMCLAAEHADRLRSTAPERLRTVRTAGSNVANNAGFSPAGHRAALHRATPSTAAEQPSDATPGRRRSLTRLRSLRSLQRQTVLEPFCAKPYAVTAPTTAHRTARTTVPSVQPPRAELRAEREAVCAQRRAQSLESPQAPSPKPSEPSRRAGAPYRVPGPERGAD